MKCGRPTVFVCNGLAPQTTTRQTRLDTEDGVFTDDHFLFVGVDSPSHTKLDVIRTKNLEFYRYNGIGNTLTLYVFVSTSLSIIPIYRKTNTPNNKSCSFSLSHLIRRLVVKNKCLN